MSGAFTSPYSPAQKRAIVSAIVDEGLKPRDAVDRAARGELAGVERFTVPLGTARDWALKERQKRARDDPGSIVTEYENARAELVHTIRAEVRRLSNQRRSGQSIDLARAREVARLMQEVRPVVQHYRPRDHEKPGVSDTATGGEEQEPPGEGVLARLFDAGRERREAEQAQQDHGAGQAERTPSPKAPAVRTPETGKPEPVRTPGTDTPSLSDLLGDVAPGAPSIEDPAALLAWVREHNPAALQPRPGQQDPETQIQPERDDHPHTRHGGDGNARSTAQTPRIPTTLSPTAHAARIRGGDRGTPPNTEHETPPDAGSPAREPRSLARARVSGRLNGRATA